MNYFDNMGNGVYRYSGNGAEIATELAKFKGEHPDLAVTAVSPIIEGIVAYGYVVSTEDKKS